LDGLLRFIDAFERPDALRDVVLHIDQIGALLVQCVAHEQIFVAVRQVAQLSFHLGLFIERMRLLRFERFSQRPGWNRASLPLAQTAA
jgi:hypothetical protein